MKKIFYTILSCLLLFSVNAFAGTSHYVDSTAAGGGDGTWATPFKTITEVNAHGFSTGDDVYFKIGQTFSDARLIIDWTGTSEDRVVIGAWEAEGDYILEGGETKPIIDGNGTSTDNAGLIEVDGESQDYVTIQDLKVYDSGGYGIFFDNADYGVVDGVDVELTYRQGVFFYYSTDSILQYSSVTDTNHFGNGAGVIMQYSTGTTIQYNKVHQVGELASSGGECINLYRSTDSVVQFNEIWDCISMGIYNDQAINPTIRYNLIYYTGDTDYLYKGAYGIGFNDESGTARHSENGEIYGNLIANTKVGIKLASGSGNPLDPGLLNVIMHNNSIIKPRDGACFDFDASSNTSGTVIKNNLCWGDSAGDMAVIDDNTGLTWDYNMWSHDPSDNDVQGANDPTYQAPQIEKTTGWDSIVGGSLTSQEFQPTAASGAGSGALDLGNGLEYVLVPDNCDFTANPITCTSADADDYAWPFGAFLGAIPYLNAQYPTSQQTCSSDPRTVTFGLTSSTDATLRFSVKGTDTCETVYADLDEQMETTGATTVHSDTDESFNCGESVTLVVKGQDDATGLFSNCVEIVVDVEASGGGTPTTTPLTINGNGNLLIVGGGNLFIH